MELKFSLYKWTKIFLSLKAHCYSAETKTKEIKRADQKYVILEW